MRRLAGGTKRFAVGVALAVAFLPVVASVRPVGAQTFDDPKTEPAAVTQEGYFTAEADGALPGTLVNEFPPGIACILAPQLCSDQAQQVTGPISSNTPDPELPDYVAPQPVESGTLPVGMLGGKPRYTSYLKFTLPDIPAGSSIDKFDLVLSESAVSYALESPAFRQAILAGLVTYQTRSPAEFTKFVGDVAEQTTPFAETAATGIELCAVTEAWGAGRSLDASTQPARDCIFGANGERDAAGTWTFDISLLAQAWLDGTTPNEGVYLGPLGADNVAFGDPDTSTNWQISLGGKDAAEGAPIIRYAFSEGFGDDESFEDLGELDLGDDGLDDGGFGVVPTADPFSVDLPDSAAAATGQSVVPDVSNSPPIHAQLAADSSPRTPWWLWLLLPFGLAVAYAFARSFEEDPRAMRAGRGALTRLMAADDRLKT